MRGEMPTYLGADDPQVREALLYVRLALRTAYGEEFFESEAAGEPEAVRADESGLTFEFEDVSYAWDFERRDVLELRRRSHFLDCRAFDRFGRPLGEFRQPLGEPSWN